MNQGPWFHISCEISVQDTFQVEGCQVEGYLISEDSWNWTRVCKQFVVYTWGDQLVLSGSRTGLHRTISGTSGRCLPRLWRAAGCGRGCEAPPAAPRRGCFQRKAPQLDEARQWRLVPGLWAQQERAICILHPPLCTERSWAKAENINLRCACTHPAHHHCCNVRCEITGINIAGLNETKWDFGNAVTIKNPCNKGLLAACIFCLDNVIAS